MDFFDLLGPDLGRVGYQLAPSQLELSVIYLHGVIDFLFMANLAERSKTSAA